MQPTAAGAAAADLGSGRRPASPAAATAWGCSWRLRRSWSGGTGISGGVEEGVASIGDDAHRRTVRRIPTVLVTWCPLLPDAKLGSLWI